MSEVYVVALLTPSPGSSDKVRSSPRSTSSVTNTPKVKEALSVLAKSVEKHEPEVVSQTPSCSLSKLMHSR